MSFLSSNLNVEEFKIIQLNIQSISSKLDGLGVLVEEIDLDMISLVEHWCDMDSVSVVSISGYVRVDYFCHVQRQHAGSMIFTKAGLQVKKLFVSDFSIEIHMEMCDIVASVDNACLGIISIYRPCTGNLGFFFEKLFCALRSVLIK